MNLGDLPEEERPRERLLHSGIEALSLSELLAIFLATGTKGKSVLALADEMLAHFGGLHGLLDASIPELMEIKGIGQTKAIQLKAIFGLVVRGMKSALPEKQAIDTAAQAFELARSEIAFQKQEALLVILRDARGCLIHRERVAIGTLSEVLAHPREIFYPAIRHKAHSMILAHNHPSGVPLPLKPTSISRAISSTPAAS